MKHIADLANQSLSTSSSGSPAKTASKARRGNICEQALIDIEQIFMRLAVIFPHTWAGQFPTPAAREVAKQEWIQGLSGLARSEIERGIRGCHRKVDENGEAWPPKLAEFRALCEGLLVDPHDQFAEAYRADPKRSLPKPKLSYDRVRPHIQAMKARLKGEPREPGADDDLE